MDVFRILKLLENLAVKLLNIRLQVLILKNSSGNFKLVDRDSEE
jgi:hypothetical protein